MVDYNRFIRELGPCYQLHIEALGVSPEHLHRRYLDDFYKAMRLRCIRRVRPTYLRLVNIHDHSHNLDRAGYRYVSDIITPSLALLAEMCPIRSIDIDAPKLDTYKVMRCFEWPVKVDSVDHTTRRIITKIHPLVAMSQLLAAYPKQITAFRFGLSHTVYMSPSIDDDDYFESDPMPFRYKRMTRYQPISFTHNNL